MALEATHLRFALDLKDKYHVQDLERYLSGTIYPDSRYITKTDRALTHPREYTDWNLDEIDDFKKGWFVHLLCDDIQRNVMRELIPSSFEGVDGQNSDVWIKRTALKVLQNMDDVKTFDVSSVLPLLSHVENPNNENKELLARYNQLFQRIYANPMLTDFDRYHEILKEFGTNADLAMKVKRQVEEYERDAEISSIVKQMYSEMILRTA